MASLTQHRLAPWIVGTAALGLVAGFAYGSSDDDTTARTSTTAVASTTSDPDSVDAPLRCIGRIPDEVDLEAVWGIHGAGVDELARGLDASPHVLDADAADHAEGRAAFRAQVLAAAEHPLVLVLRTEALEGQKELANDLLRKSRTSVVVLVAGGADLDGDDRDGYLDRTLLVAPAVGDGDDHAAPWAARVLDVASGRSTCTPPRGD